VSRRPRLESGEELIIVVTPVARGLVGPLLVLVALEGLVIWGAPQWSTLHRVEAIVLAVVGVGPALVVAGRIWRWRSHRITVTTWRVVREGGVLARSSSDVYLSDIGATHADQSLWDRVRRRGVVLLETRAGTVVLGPVRHPASLRRLIDRTRRDYASPEDVSWEDWLRDPHEGPGRGPHPRSPHR